MARSLTCGFEARDLRVGGGCSVDGATGASYVILPFLTGTATYDTGVFRSGAASLKCDSGAGAAEASVKFTLKPVGGFYRMYYRIENLPSAACVIMQIGTDPSSHLGVKLTSGGKFQLWNISTNAQIGSDSAVTVSAGDGHWWRVEVNAVYSGGNITAGTLRIDGTEVATTTGLTISNPASVPIRCGWITASVGANNVLYMDDFAYNDTTGTSQNSWPGDGKVVLLLPTSDNSAGSWRAGSAANASANGALYDGLNNTPPVGTVSPLAVTAGISNAISGATNPNGDFNMATYASAGIASGDTVNAITLIVVHGEDASTGAKTGTFTIVSNPTQTGTNSLTQFGPGAGGAVGTYPTNWVAESGTAQYGSVTLDTAPVCRITKTDTGTRAADCCFMGLYVDYTPAEASAVPYNRTPLLGPILAQ